ncbi:uncharacterized protein PG986_000160 [Apiospora aurea]|uniref:F-box domain-containing protein n=1 Tax=Apiospora aurea TaxID=335848 RepID=A0ABR1QTW0_9PEZI
MAGVVIQPFRFMDLPVEVCVNILRHTGLITPYGVVYWKPERGFYIVVDRRVRRNYKNPAALFLVSRTFHRMAVEVFYGNNDIVVKKSPLFAIETAPCAQFFLRRAHSQSFLFITSLSIKVDMASLTWRGIADLVAHRMTALRDLTIVGKYPVDNNVYNFQSVVTLTYLRDLVYHQLWPTDYFGAALKRFVVHVHSGAGSVHAGRDLRNEPVYFWESKELDEEMSAWKCIKSPNDGKALTAQAGGFVEGIVCIIPSPEP